MVDTMQSTYQYYCVGDKELDRLLRGEEINGLVHNDIHRASSLPVGQVGVMVELGRAGKKRSRPLALLCHDEDVQWLCGRYAHVRAEFSPLSAWCHLLGSKFHSNLGGTIREAIFGGTLAAWSGLVVAEASLLSGRPLSEIRIAACLASATYAVARTMALWRDLDCDSVYQRFELANKICRGHGAASKQQARVSHVRLSFQPMWRCLAILSDPDVGSGRDELYPLTMGLDALRRARENGEANEAAWLVKPLVKAVPEISMYEQLTDLTPEARLKLFDELVSKYKESGPQEVTRRNALALASGYLATVAAGGSSSLALLEDYADDFPELTGWAYLVGGIGERVTWTSAFDGLGRLVSRELSRPFRLDESPTCDFAFDEAIVLADDQLKDPLVHLRIKQARILSVALYPGVNIAVPIIDSASAEARIREVEEERPPPVREVPTSKGDNELEMLAYALWPHILPLVIEETTERFTSKRRGKSTSRGSGRKEDLQGTGRLNLKERSSDKK